MELIGNRLKLLCVVGLTVSMILGASVALASAYDDLMPIPRQVSESVGIVTSSALDAPDVAFGDVPGVPSNVISQAYSINLRPDRVRCSLRIAQVLSNTRMFGSRRSSNSAGRFSAAFCDVVVLRCLTDEIRW